MVFRTRLCELIWLPAGPVTDIVIGISLLNDVFCTCPFAISKRISPSPVLSASFAVIPGGPDDEASGSCLTAIIAVMRAMDVPLLLSTPVKVEVRVVVSDPNNGLLILNWPVQVSPGLTA
jgi:hypothetical protein